MDQLRKPKILDMSIFDWVTALLGGYIFAYYVLDLKDTNLIILFELGFIIFGIIVHKLFGINTMLGYYIGLNEKPIRNS
jgi:hypothetical protein